MPILPECSQCHRLRGYAEKITDKICARCKKSKRRDEPKEDTKENTLPKPVLN